MPMRNFLLSVTMLTAIVCAGQKPHRPDMISMDSIFRPWSASAYRWGLTYTPIGLLEWPSAAGVGISYRWNNHVELWSESSFLFNGPYNTQGPVTGIKQILQGKFFPTKNGNFFFAMELRYKSYQYRDTEVFVNYSLQDTIFGLSNFSRHYFWGGALQMGLRFNLNKTGQFQLEVMGGLGIRRWKVVRHGVPPGYEFVNYWRSVDINIHDIEYEADNFYLPGSIRVIYLFGKRLRP
ncbi:MAG TPA: hypothetical protein VHD83_01085 [Puia sp.]|nr:hypothetical protein [Puia sp.]